MTAGLDFLSESVYAQGIMLNWADRIRKAMDSSGLTLLAISRKSGVGYGRVHTFHAGRGITLDNAEKIGRAVGLDLRPAGRKRAR